MRIKDNYYLYVAEETKVIRLKRTHKPFTYGTPETVIDDIPSGGHYTRTIKLKTISYIYLLDHHAMFVLKKTLCARQFHAST